MLTIEEIKTLIARIQGDEWLADEEKSPLVSRLKGLLERVVASREARKG